MLGVRTDEWDDDTDDELDDEFGAAHDVQKASLVES